MTSTGTATSTATWAALEDGEQVYPCRCGETHTGEFGLHNYMHHNCFHKAPLVDVGAEVGISMIACPLCGQTWEVKKEQP